MVLIKNNLSFRISIFLLLTLINCKFESYITITFNEINKIISNKKNRDVLFPAEIRLQVSGSESCEREKEKIVDYIKPYFIDTQEGNCIDFDYNTFLIISGKVRLVNDSSLIKSDSKLVNFSLMEKNGDLKLILHLNSDSFYSISSFSQREFWNKIEAKDFSINLNIKNNSSQDLSINCRSCYLNDKPKPFRGTTEFLANSSIEVKLSTVFIEYILENSSDTIVTFIYSNKNKID